MRLKLVPDETRIDFFRSARLLMVLSSLLMVGSLLLFAVAGLNYGIDFRGGTLVMAETPEPEPVGSFREVLSALDFGEVAVTEVSDPGGAPRNAVMMRLGITGEDPDAQAAIVTQVQEALNTAFPGISYLQVDSVGAKVSGELVRAGILAIGLAIVAILFYVWLRFEWQFALAAVAALVHDVVLTIGIFSLVQLEFNLAIIAAILTIVGYSLNDTVIVFDRVRENLRRLKTTPLVEVLNLSLNETLSRTLMTSGTTLIALIALYFLGGEVIRGFTFAMIWGVVVGTYSSIYIASALLLRLGVKRDWSKPSGTAGTQFADTDA